MEPFSVIIGAVLHEAYDLLKHVAGHLAGGKAEEFRRTLKQRLATVLPLPANHDLIREIRSAELIAARQVERAYRSWLDGLPPAEAAADRPFAEGLDDFLSRRLRPGGDLGIDFHALTQERIEHVLDEMIDVATIEAGTTSEAGEPRKRIEAAFLGEIEAEIGHRTPSAFLDFFAPKRGPGRFGWYDIVALFVSEEIKTNERFRSIFFASELVDIKKLITEADRRAANLLDQGVDSIRSDIAAVASTISGIKDDTLTIRTMLAQLLARALPMNPPTAHVLTSASPGAARSDATQAQNLNEIIRSILRDLRKFPVKSKYPGRHILSLEEREKIREFDPALVRLPAFPTSADFDYILRISSKMKENPGHMDNFFSFVARRIIEKGSPGFDGYMDDPWCYAYTLGLLDDNRALACLFGIHYLGGGSGRHSFEELGEAFNSHAHRIGFSIIREIWPNRTSVKNTEIIVLNNISYDVRDVIIFEMLDDISLILENRKRASGNRIELMQLRRRLQLSLQRLFKKDIIIHYTESTKEIMLNLSTQLKEKGVSQWPHQTKNIPIDFKRLAQETIFNIVIFDGVAKLERQNLDTFKELLSERPGCTILVVCDSDADLPAEFVGLKPLYPQYGGHEEVFQEIISRIARYVPVRRSGSVSKAI
jgi:hypothetical protein